MIKFPDLGALWVLKKAFIDSGLPLTLSLFINNVVDADDLELADFTIASGGGYADITLLAADWTPSVTTDIAQIAQLAKVWTFTGPLTSSATIYGYLIRDNATTPEIIYYEKAANPFTPVVNGDLYRVVPTLKASKGTPA